MKKILLSLAITLTACSGGQDKKELLSDLVFLPAQQLQQKYENASPVDSTDNSVTLKFSDGYATVWYLDNDQKNAEVVRFKGLGFDPELFYNQLGWDLPHLDWQKSLGKMKVTDIHGINNATFVKSLDILDIQLENPQPQTFGKRKK